MNYKKSILFLTSTLVLNLFLITSHAQEIPKQNLTAQNTKKFIDGDIEPSLKKQLDEIGRRNVAHLNGYCTAFFINSNTLITNKHCVEGDLFISLSMLLSCQVKTKGFVKGKAKVNSLCEISNVSEYTDLAILKTNKHHAHIKKLNFADWRKSEYLYSVSYPKGNYSINKFKVRDLSYLFESLRKRGMFRSSYHLLANEGEGSITDEARDVVSNGITMEASLEDEHLIIDGSSGGLLLNDQLEVVGVLSGIMLWKELNKKELQGMYKKIDKFDENEFKKISYNNFIKTDFQYDLLNPPRSQKTKEVLKSFRQIVFGVPIYRAFPNLY